MNLIESNKITIPGKIIFDPKDATKKHENQSSWKKVAMIVFEGGHDIVRYYAWLIQKRYGVILNLPLRKAHVTVINDALRDMASNDKEALELWKKTKQKWHNKNVEVVLDLDVRTNGKYWWLRADADENILFKEIRNDAGLKEPYFNFHLTIGFPNEYNIDHSNYIHNLLVKGLSY